MSRSQAEELARQNGVTETSRYRNASLLCEKAVGNDWPYEQNIDLSDQLESLQRVLRDLWDIGLRDNPFESVAYSHAAKVVAEFPEPITNTQQLRGVEGIGRRITQTIREWLQTGHITLLNELEEELYDAKV
jgi:hypothetical protein